MSFSASSTLAQRGRKALPWLLYLYSLILFGMHFIRIFDNSFWGDEGYTIRLAQMGFVKMCLTTAGDVHPPLYYFFTQILYHLLGSHGYTYHLSAVLPYGMILILACTVIRKWFGLIPAAVVVTFSSLTDVSICYNVEARMYSLGALFVLIAYLSLYQIFHRGHSVDWVLFSVSSLCAAYTHYYALISVAFFYLTLIALIRKDNTIWKKILITYAVAVAVYLPWFFVLLKSFVRTADSWWSTDIPSLRNCVGFFFNPSWTFVFFFIAFALFLFQAIKNRSSVFFTPDMLWIFSGILSAAGTSAVGLGLSYAIRPFFLLRYLFPLTAVIYLVFGFLLSKIRWGNLLSVLLIAGVLVCNVPYYYQVYQSEKKIDSSTSHCLELVSTASDSIIYTTYYHLDWTGIDYYFPGVSHALIEQSDFADVLDSSHSEIWFFSQEELSTADQEAASAYGYTCSNLYNGAFADDTYYYVYKLQKFPEAAK